MGKFAGETSIGLGGSGGVGAGDEGGCACAGGRARCLRVWMRRGEWKGKEVEGEMTWGRASDEYLVDCDDGNSQIEYIGTLSR